jgi:Protein kinase domain/Single Cache domain 2
MTGNSLCSRCGSPQLSDALRGLCPKCLLLLAREEPALPSIDDYETTGRLGIGGMGVVYRVRHHATGRDEALKVLRAGEAATPEELQRFHAEIAAASALEHEGIVPVTHVGEHDGRPYYTMPLYTGSLAGSMDRFRAPKDAARLIAKVARAVHHAHERGVLHRDLKPENILLDAADEPHVSDFSAAKRIGEPGQTGQAPRTATGMLIGTPPYLAPERVHGGDRRVTTAVDVYSLGVILYQIITGELPFKGELETIMRAVLDAEPTRPRAIAPGVPRDLETICLKCLEKHPKQRYRSAEELADDLDRFMGGAPIAARPASRSARLRWNVVLLAVVPLVLVAGLMAWVVERAGRALADRQVAESEQILLAAKRDELRDLMALVRGAIRDLEDSGRDDEAIRAQVLERLRGLDFGEDGYFYVYDPDGRNLMHARMPQLEGGDQWNLTDDTGQPIIQQILAKARAGDGFVQIRWSRPSQQRITYKLTYNVPLPRWGWVIGTGIYLDEVKAVTHQIRTSSSAAISDAMIFIAVVAVLAASGIAGVAMALNMRQQRLADAELRKLTWQLDMQ